MSESPVDPQGPQFGIQRIYVKDVSFEVPRAPEVFTKPWQPKMKMDINSRAKKVEEHTFDPCFVTRVPSELIPLAKVTPGGKTVEVYELIINGQEISPGYSELNDPDIQRERLEHQAGGEEEQLVDYDFIETLENGMPPAGGIGIGIDRLIMMLTGAPTIRDVVLFPLLKKKE